MTDTALKRAIESALSATAAQPLAGSARALLATLGYRSDKRLDLDPNSAAEFQAQFDPHDRLNPAKALLADWRSVDLLQQITADELGPALSGQGQLFHAQRSAVDGSNIQSYLFFAVDLAGATYTRTQLAAATREINKLFPMPALVIFRYGASLTFAIIARRVHQRDANRDVLEKVTLIRDIRCASPHRAHLEILADLALPDLAAKHTIENFADLQRAWEKTLDTSELNKKFFREVANWYFWAVQNVVFPDGAGADPETRNAVSIIRLITRLIFVWFIREKGLVPEQLFDQGALRPLLRWNDPKGSTYYKAILQNLFFATLNTEMDDDRRFRGKNPAGRDSHFGISTVYRYEDYFTDPAAALRLFASIPFLNGGLFECLDRPSEKVRIDGFSDRADNPLTVPDALFFGGEQDVDLNEVFGTHNKTYKARGLLRIFDSYKFTIEENTPIEEEIALDPELLGKVFENLLAAYNPETHTTARKQTGSFYTPREIVDYMVDESLLAYLETALATANPSGLGAARDERLGATRPEGFGERLRGLLAYSDEPHGFDAAETAALIAAIDRLKCLDPACGSGAFPMGMLHKLVYVLARLDPDNSQWSALQRRKAVAETEEAYTIGDRAERKARLDDIEEAFTNNTSDYGRKLYLIENCIYGVDIQPIAVQIAKLRFFISLVVDQTVDDGRPNRGVRPLPNLETKFVAANTLIGIARPQQMAFRNPAIEQTERELAEVRRRHFAARTQATKEKYRREDQRLRGELAALLRQDGWGRDTAAQLAAWDPYDQNAHADFFDPEWMFGLTEGFDIVIGNPPYISALEFSSMYGKEKRENLAAAFVSAKGAYDIFILFIERGMQLCRSVSGTVTYITPNKYLSAQYASALRSYLLRNGSLNHLVDVSFIPVFEEASVYPVISSFGKDAESKRPIRVLLPASRKVDQFRKHDFKTVMVENRHLTLLPENIWGFLLSDCVPLLVKTISGARLLSELGDVNATSTASEADSYGRYLVDEWQEDALRTVNTGTINRYVCSWGQQELTHAGRRLRTPYLPLSKASVSARRREMYGSPKIVFAKMARRCEAFLDLSGEYASLNTNCFYNPRPGVLLQYVAAFCNSKLFMFLYAQFFGALRMSGGYFQFQAPQLRVMPVLLPSRREQEEFSQLVDTIVTVKKADPAADVSALEAEIDQRVYALYGLTAEEIRIIEGG